MFEVVFYENNKGFAPVQTYIQTLAKSHGKDSRIKLNKIQEYVSMLEEHGTQVGEPYVKHIQDDIWELRPLKDRILFFCFDGEKFVLLHCFVKKTQKTPPREIAQAKRNMIDYCERRNGDG